MAKDMLLMYKDISVLSANVTTGVFTVLNEQLLPFKLKGKLRKSLPKKEVYTEYDLTQRAIISGKNKDALFAWLSTRTLLLSRKNAKWLYNMIGIDQGDSGAKLKISIKCRAVSILDNYWIKLDGDTVRWDQIDVKRNSLNKTIAQVALHGDLITLQGSLVTPELTTQGAYAKAWRRHDDKSLWLYKKGASDSTESRIEEMVSRILDKCNVEHVPYVLLKERDEMVCACPCATNTKRSILSGSDFYSYCSANGLNMDAELERLDAESMYKMWIVDYLISNRDRHGENWGLYYEPDTMELISMHPLWDHNNAFDIGWMQDANVQYQFNGMSIKDSAHRAMRKVDFHFTQKITREDFITDRQYKSFMSRADELGIKVIPDTYEQHAKRLITRALMEINSSVSVDDAYSYLPSAQLEDADIVAAIKKCIPAQQ